MKRIIVAALLFLIITNSAYASGGDTDLPNVVSLTSTHAQTITLPYEFEPYDIVTSTATLDVDLADVAFINQVGSIGLTFFSILDNFAILGIFVVLMLAIGTIFWVWSIVTETPHTTTLRVFDAVDVAANIYDTQLELEEGLVDRAALRERDPGYWTGQRALIQGRRQGVETFRSVSRKVKSGFKRLGSGR